MKMGVRKVWESGSSKWLVTSFSRPMIVHKPRVAIFLTFMEFCIHKICEVCLSNYLLLSLSQRIDQYSSFAMLPKDISQQILNKLVLSHLLTVVFLQKFHECALEDVLLVEHPGVLDGWMDVISSQGRSLVSVDLFGSIVTDTGLSLLKECLSFQTLTFKHCEDISEIGLKNISGLDRLKELQIMNANIADFGLSYLRAGLRKLIMLNLERCNVTAACLDSISAFVSLAYLNLGRLV